MGQPLMNALIDLIRGLSADMTAIQWDNRCPGLGLRVNKTGTVWVAKYRSGGKQIMATLGKLDEMSYDQARIALETAKKGGPGGTTILFKELARIYIDEFACIHKRTWKEDARRLKRYLVPTFGDFPITEISPQSVRQLHCKLSAATPRQADHVIGLLRLMYGKAMQWGYLPENYQAPVRGVDWHKKNERDKFITEDQMPAVLAAISKLPRFSERAILVMYLLTGCRKNELVDLKWSEVDFKARVIRLSGTRNKSGEPVQKQLSDLSVSILEALPKDQTYVFPGRYKNTRMLQVSSLWRKIRVEAGVPDIVLHDLRRTCGSWLAQSGASLHLIAQVLGQTTEHVTRVYSHFETRHIKQAVQGHSDKLKQYIDQAQLLPENENPALEHRDFD